jgi:hypothetical protein
MASMQLNYYARKSPDEFIDSRFFEVLLKGTYFKSKVDPVIIQLI